MGPILCLSDNMDSPHSSVSFVTDCKLDGLDFSLHHRVQNGTGAHPTSLGVKWPGSEAELSPKSSSKVNGYTFTSSYFMFTFRYNET
jgi:hypothetical protein